MPELIALIKSWKNNMTSKLKEILGIIFSEEKEFLLLEKNCL